MVFTKPPGLMSWAASIGLIKIPLEATPRFVYPRWQREKGAVWTAIGQPGEVDEAIVGPGGEIQPWNTAFSISFWIYDRDTRALYTPEEMPLERLKWRLKDGYLPITISTWKAGGVDVEVTSSSGIYTSSKVKLSSQDTERRLYLYAAIRPHGVSARYNSINSLKFAAGAAHINGHRAIEPLNPEYLAGASQLATDCVGGDISTFASRGTLPKALAITGPATGAFRYDLVLKPGRSAEYGFVYAPADTPDTPIVVGDVQPDDLVVEAAERWQSVFSRAAQIEIPDRRMQECFYASLGYLLILKDGPYVVPGPLTYNSIWVRDATYVVDALMKAGMQSQADQAINALVKLNRPDGLMPPVFSMNLVPLQRKEWDSQGQLIHMISQRYRLTGDRTALAAQYPAVWRACAFTREIRKANLNPMLKGTPHYGIMPPSLSAEDLGREDWHHYWDDFWCIHGLRSASTIANVLGKPADALWMKKEAEELHRATMESIRLATGGFIWIPNGPEDLRSSSAARGTTAGVWPTGVLSPAESQATFQGYWDKWVKPNNGGFTHGEKFWPYATLSLAHAYLWNGDTGKAHSMVKWALEHQTAPGVYAWSEVVDPENMRFAGGDMPHGWGAAEFVLLVRDMLVRDDQENIVILPGVPEDWLRGGKAVRMWNMPVCGGKIAFEARGYLEKDRVEIKLRPALRVPIPIEVRLPTEKSGNAVLPNGRILPVVNGRFIFPQGVDTAVVKLGEPIVPQGLASTHRPRTGQQVSGVVKRSGSTSKRRPVRYRRYRRTR